MAQISSVAAVTLSIIIGFAAQAKLRNHAATSRSFRQLGLPLPSLIARLVPLVEIGIAVALILVPGWGGVAAFAMLIGFTIFLVSILRSGATVSCGCFGSANQEPVSGTEIARNLILLTLAGASVSIERLTEPTLAALMVVSLAGMIGMTLIQLVSLRSQVGSLFRIELAGEAGLVGQSELEALS